MKMKPLTSIDQLVPGIKMVEFDINGDCTFKEVLMEYKHNPGYVLVMNAYGDAHCLSKAGLVERGQGGWLFINYNREDVLTHRIQLMEAKVDRLKVRLYDIIKERCKLEKEEEGGEQ